MAKNFTGGLESLLKETNTPLLQEREEKIVEEEVVPKLGRPKTNNRTITSTSQLGIKEGETRATFIVNEDLLEKLKALSYWRRKQIKATLQDALEVYFGSISPAEFKQAEKAYKEKS